MMFSLRKNSSAAPSVSTSTVATSPPSRSSAAASCAASAPSCPTGLITDGEVMNRDGLAEALKNFVAEAGLPKSVRLGVANQQIVVRVIELPRIEDEKQRDAAVRFQAAEAIAMPLDEAVLDHQVAGYTEAPDGSPRMQVVVVAARRSMVEALLEAGQGRRPQARGHRPRRLRARADARGRRRRRVRATAPASTATSAASPTWRSRSAPPASSPGRSRRSGTTRTPAARSPTRSACRSTTTWPSRRPSRSARSCCPAPGSADEQLVESLGVHSACPTTVAAPLGVLDRSALDAGPRTRTGSPWRPAWRWERRHEGRQPLPDEQRRAQQRRCPGGSSYIVLGVLAVLLADGGGVRRSPSNQVNQRKSDAAEAKRRGRPARGPGRRARRLRRLRLRSRRRASPP